MPITEFQKQVLSLLKSNRSPDSYVAGGTAIHRNPDSIRYSADIDFFHDADQAVTDAFQQDRQTLVEAGYQIEIQIAQPSYYRASIGKSGRQLKLEWVRDTAFRYFPVVDDEVLGYRLHEIDLAINKGLALANRTVVRDAIDIIDLDRKVLRLATLVSAACGKDPGFTPEHLLEMMQRHMIFSPSELAAEALTAPIDPVKLKRELMALVDDARNTLRSVDAKDIGCLFVDRTGNVLKDLVKLDHKKHSPHFGSIKGSWPRVVD